jgi:molybdenum cofactor biosynthesis enzyme MoaA
MRKNNSGTMGTGYLKFSNFKKFIDDHQYIKKIELSNSGEIFLNPELLDIIRYADKKNVILTADNGVNFNNVSDEMLESLVKYHFCSINFSLDGASQDTYSMYRVNGNFNKVIANIKKLNEYKKSYKSEYPKLHWHFIIMDHNECDVKKAKEIAKELKMDIGFKLTWDAGYKPHNIEMLQHETGLKYLSRESVLESTKKMYYYEMCFQLWRAPQINWEGRLLGCCSDFTDDFGINVFDDGLKKALTSKNYIYAKKMLQGKMPSPNNYQNIPCVNCENYKTMIEYKQFIKLL